MIQAVPGAQPAYEPLVADRHEVGQGPAVTAARRGRARRQARRLAAARARGRGRRRARSGGRCTRNGRSGTRSPDRGDRCGWPTSRSCCRPGRRWTSCEKALDAAGIAYRAESSSLVYQAPEIRDLMATARAIADPTDQLACVTALRSPLFGCGDDDLWTWKHAGGSFNLLARAGDARRPAGVARKGSTTSAGCTTGHDG